MVTEIEKMLLESKKRLESMSALELMENAGLFTRDLQKLVDSYTLPAAVLVGCLMNVVHKLNSETDNMLLDDNLTRMFASFKRYMDKTFMKKE